MKAEIGREADAIAVDAHQQDPAAFALASVSDPAPVGRPKRRTSVRDQLRPRASLRVLPRSIAPREGLGRTKNQGNLRCQRGLP